MKSVYAMVKEFKSKYPKCIAFRLSTHAKVIEDHLYEGEKVNYVFCGQKNETFLSLFSSCVVAITDQRLIVGQKRIFWGYFFTTVTPDLYNDLKVINNLIWSDVNIDTVSEKIYTPYMYSVSADGSVYIFSGECEDKKTFITFEDLWVESKLSSLRSKDAYQVTPELWGCFKEFSNDDTGIKTNFVKYTFNSSSFSSSLAASNSSKTSKPISLIKTPSNT